MSYATAGGHARGTPPVRIADDGVRSVTARQPEERGIGCLPMAAPP